MKSLFDGAKITIMGDVIENNGTINKTYYNGVEQPSPQPQDIKDVEIVEEVKDVVKTEENSSIEEPNITQRGPRKQALFQNQDGKKDDKRTQEEADRVKRYLTAHHLGGKNSVLDSSQKTKINIVVATFWQHWNDKKWVNENFHGAAFCRFLTDDCNLQCGVEEKVFSQTIRGIIESGRDSETFANVADFF